MRLGFAYRKIHAGENKKSFSDITKKLIGIFGKKSALVQNSNIKQNIEPKKKIQLVDINREVSSEDKELAFELFDEGRNLFNKKFAFLEASARLKDAIELDPMLLGAYLMLHNTYRTYGDIKLADELRDKTIYLRDYVTQVEKQIIELFLCIHVKYNFKDLPQILKKAKEYYPQGNEEIHMAEMVMLIEKGSYKQAIKVANEHLAKDPDNNFQFLISIAWLEERKEYEEHMRLLKERVVKYPNIANLRLVLADELIHFGQHDEAEEHVRKLIEIDPINEYGPLFLASIEVQRENFKKGIVELRKAIGLCRADVVKSSCYQSLYAIYNKINDQQNASKAFKIVKNLSPERDYHSIEERLSKTNKQDLSKLKNDGLDEQVFKVIEEVILDTERETIKRVAQIEETQITNYYRIDEHCDCVNYSYTGNAWGIFSSKDIYHQIFPAIPFDNIIDVEGNILKVKYSKRDTIYKEFMGEISLVRDYKLREMVYLTTQLDSSKEMQECDEIYTLRPVINPSRFALIRNIIIDTPASFELLHEDIPPVEIKTINDRKLRIYKKIIYKAEKFNPQMKFRNSIA